MDQDSIGDACDPRPTEDGDSIALFDGFHVETAGLPDGWTASVGENNGVGDWSVSVDQLRQGNGSNTEPSILWRSDVGVVGDVLVELRGQAGGVVDVTNPSMGVIAAYTDDLVNIDSGFACTVQKTDTGKTQLHVVDIEDGLTFDNDIATFVLDTDRHVTIYHYQTGGTQTVCQAEDSQAAATEDVFSQSVDGPMTGAVGIVTKNMTGSFRYITVYALGGPITDCMPPTPCF